MQKPYPPQGSVAGAIGAGRHLSVIIVEDNPADVSLVRIALKRCSQKIELTAVLNSVDALRLLMEPSCQADLVILDINLPMIDGFGILERYLGKPNRSPVVIFTSSNRSEDLARATELGALALVEKPAELWAFHEAVFSIIRMVAPGISFAGSAAGVKAERRSSVNPAVPILRFVTEPG